MVDLNKYWSSYQKRIIDKGKTGRIRNRYVCKAQDIPLTGIYDAVVSSWGYGYMNDRDVIEFLIKFRPFLLRKDGTYGVVITKETTR